MPLGAETDGDQTGTLMMSLSRIPTYEDPRFVRAAKKLTIYKMFFFFPFSDHNFCPVVKLRVLNKRPSESLVVVASDGHQMLYPTLLFLIALHQFAAARE